MSVSVSVVVPAFNEDHRLAASLHALRRFLAGTSWRWEVRVVDDGSTDDTAALVLAAGREDPRIVLQREPHRGKGGAVRAGLLAARGDHRFMCDADLSMPVRELPRFLPPQADADVVIATREGAGARRIGEPGHRHLAGRAFNRAVQAWVLPGLHDTQCGFKMFTARAVEAIFPRVSLPGWGFDLEVLAVARAQGWRITEVPIEWHHREASHLRVVRDGAAMLADACVVGWRARTGRYIR